METWSLTGVEATTGEKRNMTPRCQTFMNVPFSKENSELGRLGRRLGMGGDNELMLGCVILQGPLRHPDPPRSAQSIGDMCRRYILIKPITPGEESRAQETPVFQAWAKEAEPGSGRCSRRCSDRQDRQGSPGLDGSY